MSNDNLNEFEVAVAAALSAREVAKLMGLYLEHAKLLDQAMPFLKDAIAMQKETLLQTADDNSRGVYIRMYEDSLKLLEDIKNQ